MKSLWRPKLKLLILSFVKHISFAEKRCFKHNPKSWNRKNQFKSQKGFTLLELMVTISALSVMVVIAAPMANSLTSRLQAKNGLGLLSASVKLAITSADHLGHEITICSSNDGSNCSGDRNWKNGWIVFYEDPGRTIIHVADPPRNIDLIASDFPDNSTIQILPTRRSVESSAEYGVIASCQLPDGVGVAGIIISNHGYVRRAVDANFDNVVEDQTGADVSCS